MDKYENEKHAYWEGVVERITNKDTKRQIFGIKFKVGSGCALCGNEYEMMRGQGFTKANMPQVGDTVEIVDVVKPIYNFKAN